jgi:hypothetical protein
VGEFDAHEADIVAPTLEQMQGALGLSFHD